MIHGKICGLNNKVQSIYFHELHFSSKICGKCDRICGVALNVKVKDRQTNEDHASAVCLPGASSQINR